MRLHHLLVVVLLASASASAQATPTQTVLDKVLSSVNGDVITALDVRQAKLLKLQLVVAPAQSDADVLRGLENRRLVLAEVGHVMLTPPTAADIDAHRRDWEATLGSGVDLPRLLDRAGLTDAGLNTWLRNDVRIGLYLAQRFGGVPEAERPAEVERWIATLREHAGLPKTDGKAP